MRPPITLEYRLRCVSVNLVLGGLVLGIGLLLLKAIGRRSPARERHGQFVLAWMYMGWVVGGMIGAWLLDDVTYRPKSVGVFAPFGLLAGWVAGMIHGGIALARGPSPSCDRYRNEKPAPSLDDL